MNKTTVFFDTEFSNFNAPQLVSFGAVTATGEHFYCEISPLPADCSDFVRQTVLPLLDGGACACSLVEFPQRLASWLQSLSAPAQLFCDSDWDILVLRKALGLEPTRWPGVLTLKAAAGESVAANVMYLPPLGAEAQARYDRAANAKFAQHPGKQHHALVDALALCAGQLAVEAGK